MRGRQQAALVAFILSWIPLLGWVAVIIMALVTLRKGAKAGAVILAVVLIPDLWAMIAHGHVGLVFVNVLYGSVLVYAAAVMLRTWPSWSMLLQVVTLFGIASVLMLHLVVPDMQAWWVKYYQHLLAMMAKAGQDLGNLKVAFAKQGVLEFVAKLSTGLVLASALAGSLLNLVLARWWQGILFNPGGLRVELYQICLHPAWCIGLIAVILAAWGGLNIAWDILPLVILPFLPAALSLVHAVFSKHSKAWVWLLVFYIALILLSPSSVIFLVLVAGLDSFYNIRARIA
jgi:hypothetical protein